MYGIEKQAENSGPAGRLLSEWFFTLLIIL
jgi:hypothetical protein